MKKAVPEPMAILIEIISLKFVDINRVKVTPIKNPEINNFSSHYFSIRPIG